MEDSYGKKWKQVSSVVVRLCQFLEKVGAVHKFPAWQDRNVQDFMDKWCK